MSEINNVMSEIAARTQEQTSGLAQVNVAVTQTDQTTQQNAAMVEETTAAAALELEERTEQLGRFIACFETRNPSHSAQDRFHSSLAA